MVLASWAKWRCILDASPSANSHLTATLLDSLVCYVR